MKLSEFDADAGDHHLTCLLAEPDGRGEGGAAALVGKPALLLTFTTSRQDSIGKEVFNIPAARLVAAGHRALSFDLPNHGQRPSDQGIAGMRDALLKGWDPFDLFVKDGRAVIDACGKRGLIGPAGVVACGLSRAGYCVLRLAAADERVGAVAALAPVTDWRRLAEFRDVKDRPEVAALCLDNWAKDLAGRSVYATIGSADDRVGTDCCVRFMHRLYEAEAAAGVKPSRAALVVTADAGGHSLSAAARLAAADHLLAQLPPAAKPQ